MKVPAAKGTSATASKGDHATEGEGQRGGEVVGQGMRRRPAAVHQNAEIPQFLGNLVCGRYQPGDDAEPDVDHESAADHSECAHGQTRQDDPAQQCHGGNAVGPEERTDGPSGGPSRSLGSKSTVEIEGVR